MAMTKPLPYGCIKKQEKLPNSAEFPYVESTVETADKIDEKQEIIDTDFIDLKSKFDKVNDAIS